MKSKVIKMISIWKKNIWLSSEKKMWKNASISDDIIHLLAMMSPFQRPKEMTHTIKSGT